MSEEDTEEFIIDYKGSYFPVLRRKEGGFLCPICKGRRGSPIFFSESDLIKHIIEHDNIMKFFEIQKMKEEA